jgi:hypothetical protein
VRGDLSSVPEHLAGERGVADGEELPGLGDAVANHARGYVFADVIEEVSGGQVVGEPGAEWCHSHRGAVAP